MMGMLETVRNVRNGWNSGMSGMYGMLRMSGHCQTPSVIHLKPQARADLTTRTTMTITSMMSNSRGVASSDPLTSSLFKLLKGGLGFSF